MEVSSTKNSNINLKLKKNRNRTITDAIDPETRSFGIEISLDNNPKIRKDPIRRASSHLMIKIQNAEICINLPVLSDNGKFDRANKTNGSAKEFGSVRDA